MSKKAQRYDEALKVLHKYDGANIMFSQDLKEEMFPELKESGDEKVRKEIIKYLEQTVPHHHRDEVLKSKEWIAWLERQGEYKPQGKSALEAAKKEIYL